MLTAGNTATVMDQLEITLPCVYLHSTLSVMVALINPNDKVTPAPVQGPTGATFPCHHQVTILAQWFHKLNMEILKPNSMN